MALGDVFQIPQIIGELTLQKINTEIRRIWQQINYLAGRNASPEVRDSLTVRGLLTAGSLDADVLTLGSSVVTPVNPTLSPTTEATLIGRSLVTTNAVGVGLDLLEEGSIFTMGVKDDFISVGSTSGQLGELGWETVSLSATPTTVGEPGHPGVYEIASNVAPDVAYIRLNAFDNRDVRYLAAVVRTPATLTGMNLGFGYTTTNPLAGVEAARGVYISYVNASSANWRAHVQNASGAATTTSTIPVLDSSWYLLEIVLNVSSGSQIADFYVNRLRLARHTTFIDAGGTNARPILIVQAVAGGGTTAQIDQFVLTGAIPLSTKRWS